MSSADSEIRFLMYAGNRQSDVALDGVKIEVRCFLLLTSECKFQPSLCYLDSLIFSQFLHFWSMFCPMVVPTFSRDDLSPLRLIITCFTPVQSIMNLRH
jgi:hypothetical protein